MVSGIQHYLFELCSALLVIVHTVEVDCGWCSFQPITILEFDLLRPENADFIDDIISIYMDE